MRYLTLRNWVLLGFFFCLFITYKSFADDGQPAPEFGAAILALYAAIKGKLGAAAILSAVFQILKSVPGGKLIAKLSAKGQRIALALIAVGGFILEAYLSGDKNWTAAIVYGLTVSGGAILIYDAFKGKPAEVKVIA